MWDLDRPGLSSPPEPGLPPSARICVRACEGNRACAGWDTDDAHLDALRTPLSHAVCRTARQLRASEGDERRATRRRVRALARVRGPPGDPELGANWHHRRYLCRGMCAHVPGIRQTRGVGRRRRRSRDVDRYCPTPTYAAPHARHSVVAQALPTPLDSAWQCRTRSDLRTSNPENRASERRGGGGTPGAGSEVETLIDTCCAPASAAAAA
jgi:hypothetical protein